MEGETERELRAKITELEQELAELQAQSQVSDVQFSHVLEESDRKFRTLFNGISLPVFVHPLTDSGFANFIEVNDSACARYGYSREEFLRLSPADISSREDTIRRSSSEDRRELGQLEHRVFEAVHIASDGSRFPVEISSNIFKWMGAKVILSIARDITFQVRAQESLRSSEEKFRSYIESSPDGIFVVDGEGKVVEVNQAAVNMTHRPVGELIGLHYTELMSESDRKKALTEFEQIKERGRGGGTLSFQRPSGSWSYWKVNAVRVSDDRLMGFVTDITEVMRAEKTARAGEKFIASLLTAIPAPVFFQDAEGNYRGCNQAYTDMTGITNEQMRGKSVFDLWPQAIARSYREKDMELLAKPGQQDYETKVLDVLGRERAVMVNRNVMRDDDGNVIGMIGAFLDITEKKATAEALKKSERQLSLLMDNSIDVIWTMDRELRFTYASPAIERHTGYTSEEWVGTRLSDHSSEKEYRKMEKLAAQAMEEHLDFDHVIFESKIVRKNGEEFPVEITAKLVRDSEGIPVGFQGTTRDITQKKRTEEDLKDTDAYLEYLFTNVPAGIMVVDSDTRRIIDVNRYTCQMIGLTKEEIIDHLCSQFISCSGRQCPILDRGERLHNSEMNLTTADGREIPVVKTVISARLKNRNYLIELFSDISKRKRAEEERQKLVQQLQQAQKMESIGTMAGGIAHDFNNLLTVINGYSQMALEGMSRKDPLYEKLEQILLAGRSAGNLTSQLLAFSRKQLYSPEPVDINGLIEHMDRMLRRLIGEDIAINADLQGDLPSVYADRSQLEQVLVNLTVNARDALYEVDEEGFHGMITIQTGKALLDEGFVASNPGSSRGQRVYVSVSDNGVGIPPENLSRIFEPFFTTKESHRGTGLGLSTVYGIVKQNQGYITVESTPGQGSEFRVYWPVVGEKELEAHEEGWQSLIPTGTERILLVEDNDSVSSFAEEALENLGYTVSTAENGRIALEMLESKSVECDLIITDLIMPETGGQEFAEKAAELVPNAGVIYMSGYTDGQIVHDGMLEKGINFLRKPFSVKELALMARKVLDGEKE